MRGRVFGVQTGYNFQSGKLAVGRGSGPSAHRPSQQPGLHLPWLHLQSGRAGGCCVRSESETGLVRDLAATLRRARHARPSFLRHRRRGGCGAFHLGQCLRLRSHGNPAINPFSNRSINAGWAAGGGIEAHLTGNWTGKLEYLYMDFGSVDDEHQQSAEHDADRRSSTPTSPISLSAPG